MNKIGIIVLLVSGIFLSSCGKESAEARVEANVITTSIALPTAKCGMCKKTIKNALIGKNGISQVKVSGESPEITAAVSYDTTKTTEQTIWADIAAVGYTAGTAVRDSAAYEALHECCK